MARIYVAIIPFYIAFDRHLLLLLLQLLVGSSHALHVIKPRGFWFRNCCFVLSATLVPPTFLVETTLCCVPNRLKACNTYSQKNNASVSNNVCRIYNTYVRGSSSINRVVAKDLAFMHVVILIVSLDSNSYIGKGCSVCVTLKEIFTFYCVYVLIFIS